MRAVDRAIQLERVYETAAPVAEKHLIDLGDGLGVFVDRVREPTEHHLGNITGRPAWIDAH
jgi:hypothetical protein